ncbi:helix-turn-helix domain-containing protein [Dactylosporangium matsuzakiense]|uniref:HTH cro/C1-type domain-containing protein n=1 Tax=Dactylosporangium matsuzakiense TaxID=53360 RepID=A0A9W6NS84_9ACTN|nr:helix-turn-helix transcriptional regulator [Dactylosporangium matsuzakiense]GLL06912.1 hypothetical protein GCM10017581_086620 [Dactylosporangium matsuzakiense]
MGVLVGGAAGTALMGRDSVRTGREPGPAQRRFCADLRSWRELRQVSQEALAGHVLYSREWVAKVERGTRWPTEHLARRADAALHTGGVLLAQWPAVRAERDAAMPSGPRPLAPVLPLFPARAAPVPPDTVDALAAMLTSLLREVPGAQVVVVSVDAEGHVPAAAGDDVDQSAVLDLARFRAGPARRRRNGHER